MRVEAFNGAPTGPTIHGRVARVMERWPHRIAVVHRDRAWSYADLAELAGTYQRRLGDGGFVRGDRALLWMENSAEYIAAYLAVLTLGGVVVALHAQAMPEEVARIVRLVDASALVTSSPVWRRSGEGLADSGPRVVLTERETHRLPGRPSVEPAPEGLAQIIYTSGSTGQPKGVMLSHGNLLANADAITEYLRLRETDGVMAVLPFVYSYGNSVMLTHLLAGGKLVIENSFVYPKLVLDRMAGESVTGFSGVASTYALLLSYSALDGYAFPTLRYLTHAGGPLPLELLDRLRGTFDDKAIYVMYGQTEASARLTYLPPEMIDPKRGSAGRAIPGVTIRIVNRDGDPLPAGTTGEVTASGENIMMGYWRHPELTREVLRDGWLRTGDIGRLDEDGFLYIVGRNSEIIKSGAFRISPYEIEEVLMLHPDVYEAGVVGLQDPILGETIYGMVAPREGRQPGEQELLAFCARHLAPYKRPKAILQVATLPKSPSGKILRHAIKEDLHRRFRESPTQVNS